jgi:hypothetical protein
MSKGFHLSPKGGILLLFLAELLAKVFCFINAYKCIKTRSSYPEF